MQIERTAFGERIRNGKTYLAGFTKGKAKWTTDWLYAKHYKDASKTIARLKGETL